MGEVLKVLKETKLGGGKFLIELNEPLAKGTNRVIHIQNDKFRMEMIEPEFLKIAGAIVYAKKNFDVMKGWGKK